MAFPQDNWKKTEKISNPNSPPEEQAKESPSSGSAGDAQKLKMPSEATKKFKQMYLKMLASHTDSVAEKDNLPKEKHDESYIALDFKPKSETLPKITTTEQGKKMELPPASKRIEKISGKYPAIEAQNQEAPLSSTTKQNLPTAKGILDKWKMYRQQSPSQEREEQASYLMGGNSQGETENIPAEKFLGFHEEGGKKTAILPFSRDKNGEEENFKTEKRPSIPQEEKTASRKIESFTKRIEDHIARENIAQKPSETRELPLPIGKVESKTQKNLFTQRRKLDSISLKETSSSNPIEQGQDGFPVASQNGEGEEKPVNIPYIKRKTERFKLPRKVEIEKTEEISSFPEIQEYQKSPDIQSPDLEEKNGLATAIIPAEEFLMPGSSAMQEKDELATADIPAQEFLMSSATTENAQMATADIPAQEFLEEPKSVATNTVNVSTKEWKRIADQSKTGEISDLISKDTKRNKPIDIDLTVAAKEGEFNPNPKKNAAQNFSWESLLLNKTIAKDRLVPSSSEYCGLDAIKINRFLGRGANGEVYEVECKRFYPYKYALKIPLLPLAKNGPIFERELAQFHRIQAAESLHIPKILTGEFSYENMTIPYYVTYLLSPLEKALNESKKKLIPPPLGFSIFYSLLKALEDLSYGFIIHNDIKPDNIMFCRDVPMLVDFGVSKSYSEINELELWKKRGYLHGTPVYLPPEVIQIENHPDGEHIMFCLDKVSQRMDIWALGITFMEWLTGHRVFHDVTLGANVLEMLGKMQHLFEDGYIQKYREQCHRRLTRMYLGTDVLTQQRMKDFDILAFYDKKYVHKQKVDVEDIEVKKVFLNDIFKVFDLCTLPYDKRPKAPQLLEEIKGIFPQAQEKYGSLYYDSITPPLEKTFLKKLNVESFKKTYYLLKGRRQYEAKRDGGWQCMSRRYDQWISVTTIFNDFFTALNIKNLEGPDKKDLLEESVREDAVLCQLFPFDIRYAFYHNLIKRDKSGLLKRIGQDVPTFVLCSQHSQEKYSHIFATKSLSDSGMLSPNDQEEAFLFPLYTVSEEGEFVCNLSPLFTSIIEQEMEWEYITEEGDFEKTFNQENAFHYIYAILHSPTYRTRYSKHFQKEFCRIPVINQKKLFKQVSLYGKELLSLHFLEAPSLTNPYVSCPVTGHNKVDEKFLRYMPATESRQGRVYINEKQYFEGINQQVWEFCIGNYQICHEFLKNHLGMSLDYDELVHYQKTVFAIQETIRIMEEIDKLLFSAWTTVEQQQN